MDFKSKLQRKVLSGQAREVIANVIFFMQREAEGNKPLKDFNKVQERAAIATGVSLSTIRRISREMKSVEEGASTSFSTPNEKRRRATPKSDFTDFDRGLLRRFIINFYITEKKIPTLRRIQRKFVQEHNYTGSHETLRKVMRTMGFRWRKAKTNRRLLMEKPEIQHLRRNFLRRMKEYREKNRPIIYMDETYIHSSHTHEKSWSDNTNEGLRRPVSKGQRFIIVHAGGENGFVENAYLKFKSNSKSGDYHSEMNYSNYKKWLQDKLIPNLPPNSVLVIDNAPYHNVQIDKCPTMCSKKDHMKEWLRKKNIHFTEDMLKIDLYGLIKMHKPAYITYEIDRIMAEKGHSVLRLPPYHPDLNPIELAWASLKQYVAERNVDFNSKTVDKLCDDFFSSYPTEEWKKRCEHAKGFEKQYMDMAPALDLVLDEIIINVNEDSDSESEDFDLSSSDSDSELSGFNPL